MAFAFELEAAPTIGLRRLHAAVVAMAAAGFGLAGWLAPQPWASAFVAGGVATCWIAWRHGGRGLAWGRLAVDPFGRAFWRESGAALAQPPRPVRIERWCATERLVWVRLRLADDPRGRDVLVARGGCDAGQWRSLRSWLIWLGRGTA